MEHFPEDPEETPPTTPFDEDGLGPDDPYELSPPFLNTSQSNRDDYLSAGRRYPLASQAAAEDTYSISTDPLPAEVVPHPDEIVRRLELEHVVKTLPRFEDQCKDLSRTNLITYIQSDKVFAKGTSLPEHRNNRRTLSEHEALEETRHVLQEVIKREETWDPKGVEKAHSILDTTSVIANKEYDEAAAGFATYWKALLEQDPNRQILAMTGLLQTKGISVGSIKSDEYFLDSILAHFNDEEAERYHGRLIVDPTDIKQDATPEELKAVFVDDWTISGAQLDSAMREFLADHPGFESSLEVQLIVANEDRITHGLERTDAARQERFKVPVRAYFKAHHSPGTSLGEARITGTHSAVDFGFEQDIQEILEGNFHVDDSVLQDKPEEYFESEEFDAYLQEMEDRQKADEWLEILPPLTNIVRPFRAEEGFRLTQRERFKVNGTSEAHNIA